MFVLKPILLFEYINGGSEVLQTKILKRAVFHNSHSFIAELVVVIHIFGLILGDWYYLPIDEDFQVYSI